MIYVCIPSHNEASTVGLTLWKTRRAFEDLQREYHVLVANDGSQDHTEEVLANYADALPISFISQKKRRGYAISVETLLRKAVEMSDRPKRDGAIILHADLQHDPTYIGEFLKKLDSGADLVVGEPALKGPTRGYQLTKRWAKYLLGKSAGAPEVRDPTSGFTAFRLITLRSIFSQDGQVLATDGWGANAELVGRAAVHARRVETVQFEERHDLKDRPSRVHPWPLAKVLWHQSSIVRQAVLGEHAGSRPKGRREKETVAR